MPQMKPLKHEHEQSVENLTKGVCVGGLGGGDSTSSTRTPAAALNIRMKRKQSAQLFGEDDRNVNYSLISPSI